MKSVRIGAYAMCCCVAACATNPVTGKSQLMLMSESQEIGMGKQMLAETQTESGFYNDAPLQSYVSEIGLREARASERPALPWEFHVIDDPVVNAFAAPGGFVFITRGILAHLNSEAELAAVLGHETGHVTARHSAAMASQQMLAQGGLLVGGVLRPDLANGLLGSLVGGGAALYFLKFSRNDEKQADGLGHRYALHARYDPREMPKTFQTLQRVSVASGSRMPGYLSTHPDPGDRVQYTQAWADTVKSYAGLIVDRDRYLAHIDGMLFGDDPEQGYFEANRYLHPALRFRFDMPAGWHGVNQREQVVAAEPNGIAQIVLSQAKEATPNAAALAFVSQKGIINQGSLPVNSPSGAGTAVRFTATSSAGQQLQGTAMFLPHGGSVFRVLGVSLAGAWSALGGAINQSLVSFGPTAPNQQFRRRMYLRVVTLPRSTSVADLAQQSGGAITGQQLAIINGVADNATMAGGTKVKTVGYR